MGTYVIEEARRRGTAKTVLVAPCARTRKRPPVPFKEESLWNGYPEETNAPYGIAKLRHPRARAIEPSAVRPELRVRHPDEPLRPRRQVPSGRVARHPRAHQKCVEAKERGAITSTCGGTGSAFARVPVRRRRRGRRRAGRRALRRSGADQPRRQSRAADQRLVELIVDAVGFEGTSGGIRRSPTVSPGAASTRPGARMARVHTEHSVRRRPPRDGRVVPQPSRGGRATLVLTRFTGRDARGRREWCARAPHAAGSSAPTELPAGEREVGLTLHRVVDGQRLVHDLRVRSVSSSTICASSSNRELTVVADVDRSRLIAVEQREEPHGSRPPRKQKLRDCRPSPYTVIGLPCQRLHDEVRHDPTVFGACVGRTR